MTEENEPTIQDSPAVEPTPEESVAVELKPEQPIEETPVVEAVAPVVEEENLEELKAKNKRYLEQMRGWKQKAEEAEASVILKQFTPEPVVATEPREDYGYEAPPQVQPQRNNVLDRLAVLNAINYAKSSVAKAHQNDSVAPWDDGVEAKIEREILALDPKGISKLNPVAWEKGYRIVRAEMLDAKLHILETEKKKTVAKREKDKTISTIAVTSASKPTEAPSKPSLNKETLAKMTSAEIRKNFPEIFEGYFK